MTKCTCDNFESNGVSVNADANQCKHCLGYKSGLEVKIVEAKKLLKSHGYRISNPLPQLHVGDYLEHKRTGLICHITEVEGLRFSGVLPLYRI